MSFGRITNLMVSQQILGEINQSQDTLDNTEEELSTGLSINEPSDNPYGAALAVNLNGQLSSLLDYAGNISDATAWTDTASTAMQSIQSDIQRAQELVTGAANGSNSQSDLDDIADEVTQLITSVQSSANTQYNGQYVFAGSEAASATEPYSSTAGAGVYNGDSGAVTRVIGAGSGATVTVNANLSSVLNGTVPSTSGSGTTSGLFQTLNTIVANLQSGNTAALGSDDLTNLSSDLNALSGLQTQVGTVQNQLTMASSTISSLQTSVTSELSDDQDANMASTMTAFSNEQAAFTAALKAGANIVQSSLMDFLSTD